MSLSKFLLILLILAVVLIKGLLLVLAGGVQWKTTGCGEPHISVGFFLIALVVGAIIWLFFKLFIK